MREFTANWQHGCVLVCTHEREKGGNRGFCGADAGAALRDALKADFKARGLKGKVLCAKSSCLGVCPRSGVTVAALPDPRTGRGRELFIVQPDDSLDEVSARIRACLGLDDG